MNRWSRFVLLVVATATASLALVVPCARADEPKKPDDKPAAKAEEPKPAADAKPGQKPFAVLMKDATKLPGLIPLYRTEGKVYAELSDSLLGKEFFVLISIARGNGGRFLLGGMSWGDGDDWVWQFRKVDDSIHVIRKNVRFFADKGSPEAKAVDLAYTDSVLFSVPIAATSPSGGHVIDFSPIFFTDLPRISDLLAGFSFARDRTTWASVKAFPDNVELQVAATYSSSGKAQIETVPDSRGATVTVHYSLSLVPQNSYTPRLADDRVGYFVTALKDFSQNVDEDRFVRYINRWHLEKADPSAEVSPPKRPIVFWIERTVPFRYRQPIREGIEAWNTAFEKAGFASAIEVRQQPDKTDWDPEDVNYNTFRWITAGAGFAMGPSRVNPRTGQILDADIIFDGDFLQFWRTQYETFSPSAIAWLAGRPVGSHDPAAHGSCCGACMLFDGHARETALAATMLAVAGDATLSDKEKEKVVVQGLKMVAMHEVGHTLGLRHNFKGTAFRSIADFNDVSKTSTAGGSTSVMDYIPVNIMPAGKTQGDYYATTLGPYDLWAIEYGYKPLPGGSPDAERPELATIASRSGEPALAYATDEDTEPGDPDPLSNRFDLGRDPLEFATLRAELVAQALPKIADRLATVDPKTGAGGYSRVRQAFGVLLSTHGEAMAIASRLIGGIETSRSHKGDDNAPPPFRVVAAQKQRDALSMLEKHLFAATPFTFSPELLNQLVATRWLHWGAPTVAREDYPVHDVVLMWQNLILSMLLDPATLSRIRDGEMRIAVDADAFTTAELLDRLTKAILTEIQQTGPGDYTARKPAIASLRRALQRAYVARLAGLAMESVPSLPDAQALAAMHLRSTAESIDSLLAKQEVKLDDVSRAHLIELGDRIDAVLDADLQLPRP